MTTARGLLAGAACLLGVAAGCADAGPRKVLRAGDTVELRQPADEPLARPAHLAVDADGRIQVTDGRDPRVLVFDADGALVAEVGEEGGGPGELRDAGLSVPLPGQRVAVAGEGERPGLFVFDLRTGEHRRTVRLDREPSWVVPAGSVLHLGSIDHARGTSALRLDLAGGERSAYGPVPPEYVPGGPRAGIFHRSFAVPLGDRRRLVAFEALGEVLVLERETDVASRLRLPAPRRRGIPDDFDARLEDALGRSYGEVFARGSALVHAAPAGDGRVAVVHHDFRAGVPPLPEAAWLTVIDPGERRVCADVPIPLGPDTPPVYAWHDGRLAVLQQRVDGAIGSAQPVLRWYAVELDRCRWREVG